MILRKKKGQKRDTILEKSKSFATVSAMCLTGVALLGIATSAMVKTTLPKIAYGYDTAEELPASKLLKLTTNSPKAIAVIDLKPEIEPGESILQKEARELAEAEAKAKAAIKNASSTKATRSVVARERRTYADPTDFNAVYAAAEAAFGVDARLLRAIHYVETGASGSTTKSNPSGATGPMQFLPSTFNRHAIDGNSDGIKDIHNLEDSVFTAAAYLRACGYPNLKSAILGYNRSMPYYNKVMKVATSLGFQQ